jgi:uncharacterized glyoxalase superfamily protein PhnB
MVHPIPEGHPRIIPHLVVRGASDAIEFYTKAFDAQEKSRTMTEDEQYIIHAELQIQGNPFFLNDEMPGMVGCLSPDSFQGTTVAIHLWTEDVDALFKQAVEAGATERMPVTDMFWGDRFGHLYDPFGHLWAIATRKENLTPEQIQERQKEFFEKMKEK